MEIGDKFTIVPPNNHLVETVTRVTATEVWGTAVWNKRDCIPLTADQAEYMEKNMPKESPRKSWWRKLLNV